MGTWYAKYLSIFSKPYSSLDKKFIAGLHEKIVSLQSDNPVASVVIIARNEERRLVSCIWSLAESKCSYPIEIICVDNASTDRTAEVIKDLGVRYLHQPRMGHGHARQCGLENARGKYYFSADADTIYPENYLQIMIKNLEKPGTVAVTGPTGYFPDRVNSRFMIRVYQALRDVHLRLLFRTRPELVVRGVSFGFVTAAGLKYGFRTNIKRGEDGSMALCLKNEGTLRQVHSGKARCMTETGHIETRRSLVHNFKMKFLQSLKNPSAYLKKKDFYEDGASNLIEDTKEGKQG